MYPTSPTYITQATAQTRRSNVRIVAYEDTPGGFNWTEFDPLSIDFSDKREGFVGGFSARTITVVSEELPDLNFSHNINHLKVYVGFAGATEEVLLGQFYIDLEDITYDDIKHTYTFVAYDKATMFDIQYEPLTFPATGVELIGEIATRLDVELDTFSLPFDNYTFNEINIAGDDVITYRQVVSRYAQLNLATAHITADGKLTFKSAFTQSPVATVDGADYTDLKITKDIRPINALVYNQEAVEDPVYVRDEISIDTYGLNELRFENNLFIDLLERTEQQSILTTLFGVLEGGNVGVGYIYYPFSTNLFIRPDLDAMDIISIQDTSDVVYNTVLENMSWTWNGGLKGTMECNILPETLTDYTLSKAEYDTLVMGVKVNRVEGRIQSYVSNIQVGARNLLLKSDESFTFTAMPIIFLDNTNVAPPGSLPRIDPDLEGLAIITSEIDNFEYLFMNSKIQAVVNLALGVTDMSYMFFYSSETELDLSGLDTSNVTNMTEMFNSSRAIKLDLSGFDTSNVISMDSMFEDALATKLDLSSFDTSNVTSMAYMFRDSQATELDLSSFNTSNVANMYMMFRDSQATTLDLSSFDTSNITNMSYMFYGSQATTLDLSGFDTSNITTMRQMFHGSQATTLDLSSFDTSNVTSMYMMFRDSQATELDLSSFDTSNVIDMSFMFENSSATIGYARTQADADRFNTSSGKPAGLTFIVKP